MTDDCNVLVLGYAKSLHYDGDSAASDGVNRRRVYAENLASYTHITLSLSKDGLPLKKHQNILALPTNGKSLLHALLKMYWIGRRVCKQGRINVIHAQEGHFTGLVGLLLKKEFKRPLSISVFGPNPWDKGWVRSSYATFVLAFISKIVIRCADKVIVDGSLTLDSLRSRGIVESKLLWKVNVPSNITDFFGANDGGLRKALTKSSSNKIILLVGNMGPQKNVDFAIDVIGLVTARFPEARFVMVGGGVRQEPYKELARKKGLEKFIHWVDSVRHTEMPSYYKACDIVILTSRYEGFPRVFLEASAASKPIVTTLVSGVGDGVINERNGFVVEQNNANEMARKIGVLLKDAALAKSMGSEGCSVVEQILSKRQYFDELQVKTWKLMI